jgi:hypothetical protein
VSLARLADYGSSCGRGKAFWDARREVIHRRDAEARREGRTEDDQKVRTYTIVHESSTPEGIFELRFLIFDWVLRSQWVAALIPCVLLQSSRVKVGQGDLVD